MAVKISVGRSPEHDGSRVYGDSYSYPRSILAKIPTGGHRTERVDSNRTEGGQQGLHYLLGSSW